MYQLKANSLYFSHHEAELILPGQRETNCVPTTTTKSVFDTETRDKEARRVEKPLSSPCCFVRVGRAPYPTQLHGSEFSGGCVHTQMSHHCLPFSYLSPRASLLAQALYTGLFFLNTGRVLVCCCWSCYLTGHNKHLVKM